MTSKDAAVPRTAVRRLIEAIEDRWYAIEDAAPDVAWRQLVDDAIEAEAATPAADDALPPWDHPYESSDDSMACKHCGWVGSYAHTVEFYQKWVFPALAQQRSEPAGLDVERLAKAGFEPDFNVCARCHHHGSRHDLNNRCLDCIEQVDDYFVSMSKEEQWAWGVAEYVRLTEADQ